MPEKEESVSSKVYVTVVPVPVSKLPPAVTLVPHVAAHSTGAYMASGTAASTSTTKGAHYSAPPYEFEGAASRVRMGVSALVVVAAGVFLL